LKPTDQDGPRSFARSQWLAGMPPNELERMIEKWRKNTTE
jgi:hypothetical protein